MVSVQEQFETLSATDQGKVFLESPEGLDFLRANVLGGALDVEGTKYAAIVRALPAFDPKTTKGRSGFLLAHELQNKDFTLEFGDASKIHETTKNTVIKIAIPLHSNVAFNIGAQAFFVQGGNGQIVFDAANGVTIQTPETLKSRKKWSTVSLIKTDQNEWVLAGDLEKV